ncbi:helix-turn-helix domain-containing protein [uncultured Sphingomonas sp.]|uniref:helix-turn-helix domain-containing protein n=1 Tax=uncultured Sphingomonas sp. TaxID=158754 RepID=UPI0025FA795A|nr:helix-turn-helix domain-containing protein [uncultured Sphingomonas sp.]
MTAVFDVAGLAKHWGCSTDTIYSLIASGNLAAFKLGGKLLRIRSDEVERFECQTTASNDTATGSPSSGTRTESAAATRLERLIDRPPSPPRELSGSVAR